MTNNSSAFLIAVRTLLLITCFVGTLQPAFTSAQTSAPIIDRSSRFHPTSSSAGMVVSQEALASRIGSSILDQGGNAIDAAVATGFALAVTFPQAGNIGGGGFMLVHLADSSETIALDYREIAPLAAHPDLFLDEAGEPDRAKSLFSIHASGVPGTVAGLVYAQNRYGDLSLAEVMQPAIELAGEGFVVSESLAYSLSQAEQRLSQDATSWEYFSNAGESYQAGELLVQSELAQTLRLIADTEGSSFYRGETANLIIETSDQLNGSLTLADLDAYRVVERPVVTGSYRGYQIASMPPPSSGGVHLVQMLNVLEEWDLEERGHNSSGYIHLLVETMKYAYADRSKFLGDPDYVDIPVAALTSKQYADQIREKISGVVTPAVDISPATELPFESNDTTHFSVWDSEGNVVSNTYTLNLSYGSGISVKGAGFLLNNEMDDFSSKPGTPNAYGLLGGTANSIEAGKRPLSSMTPTIVFKDGEPWLVTGSPGGSRIITTVLQTLLNHIDFEMNAAESIAAPRIHHQWLPDRIEYESGISADTLSALEEMGHILGPRARTWGKTQTIQQVDGEQLQGQSDYRWPGGEATPSHH